MDERELDWFARYQRSSVAPGSLIAETWRFLDTDVRATLRSVHVPTLVFGDRDDSRPGRERSVSSPNHIAGARLVELSSGAEEFHWYGRRRRHHQGSRPVPRRDRGRGGFALAPTRDRDVHRHR